MRSRAARGLQAQVKVAGSQPRHARSIDYNDLKVRAPFDGVVISKDAQPGEMISPMSAGGGFTRTGIATIVDMDSREVEVDVNEAYINRVKANQRVEATLDAYPDRPIPAHVINIVPTADRTRPPCACASASTSSSRRSCRTWASRCASSTTSRPKARSPRRACGRANSGRRGHPRRRHQLRLRVQDGAIERVAVRTGGERDGQVEVLSGINPATSWSPRRSKD